jgi:hypothetical protein
MRLAYTLGIACLLALLVAAPAPAIIGGGLDDGNHPYVGAVGGLGPVTPTGVLVSPTVFLTAGHVTRMFDNAGVTRASVTFDQAADWSATWYSGTVHTNPGYAPSPLNDRGDLGVIVFDAPVPVAPASLPTAGLLDQLAPQLPHGGRFTAVGYGITNYFGSRPDIFSGGQRKVAGETFLSLTPGWLRLQMHEDGQLCIGDSGAPSLVGTSDVIAGIFIGSLSLSGGQCESAAWDQRLDTPGARAFLTQYVTLP